MYHNMIERWAHKELTGKKYNATWRLCCTLLKCVSLFPMALLVDLFAHENRQAHESLTDGRITRTAKELS